MGPVHTTRESGIFLDWQERGAPSFHTSPLPWTN
jgi:hypothetical protein